MKTETKSVSLEIKEILETGEFSGYLSVFNVVDLDSDVVLKGAFKRSIDSKRKIPILWQHQQDQPIGLWIELIEDDHGLFVKGKLAVDTDLGQRAYSLLKMGAIDGLSIGYIVVQWERKNGIRYLKEVKLIEGSVVTFPANPDATVEDVKSAKTKMVDGEQLPSSAFAYVGDPAKTDTWKLPIHFSTPEKSAAHIRNALARFGQTTGIPESERSKVLARIHAAAHSHGIDITKAACHVAEEKAMTFTDALAARQTMQELRDEYWTIESAMDDAAGSILSDESTDKEAKKKAMREALHQYADARADIQDKMIDAMPDPESEDADDSKGLLIVLPAGVKAGTEEAKAFVTKAKRAARMPVLDHMKGMQKCSEAMAMLHKSMQMHQKGIEAARQQTYSGIVDADDKTPKTPSGGKSIDVAKLKADFEAKGLRLIGFVDGAPVTEKISGDSEEFHSLLLSSLGSASELLRK